jgi:prepilin-type N-terminal cleavage/methylation domain-containing protein
MRKNHLFNRDRVGFSLIELVVVIVIIAIIGAIAIPKMSRGSVGAGDSSLIQDLSILRSAVDMYNTEHPTAQLNASSTTTVLTEALTEYSDSAGANFSTSKSTTCIYGPYVKTFPILPVGTNKSQNGITVAGPAGTGAYGWYFDGTTFWANDPTSDVDASGTAYNTY